MYQLSEIWVYPIKSLKGVSLNTVQVSSNGLQNDRIFMLVDKDGRFLTQRECPKMAILDVVLTKEGIQITDPDEQFNSILIPYQPEPYGQMTATIWDFEYIADTMPPEVNNWFSKVLNRPCKLVFMSCLTKRPVKHTSAKPSDVTTLTDGFPLSIIGQATLDNLNNRLKEPIEMNRFRPNLVFTGGEPHDEDRWKNFHVKNSTFRVAKPCARCVMITIDQTTGQKGTEPLKTLALYRQENNKILFGQNLLIEHVGTNISVGDEIIVF